jgi:hypothetical protein
MKLIDRIALNRLINIITNFIISLTKLFLNKKGGIDDPQPNIVPPKKRKKIIPFLPLFPKNKNNE